MDNSRMIKLFVVFVSFFISICAAGNLVLEGDLAVDMKWDSQTKPNRNLFEWTQLGIVFKSAEELKTIRAYFPLSLKGKNLKLSDDSDWYLATDEIAQGEWRNFYGSDYYFVVKGTPLSASISNRKNGEDQDYSFISFADPLGAFIAPNSDQPIMTTRVGGDLGKTRFSVYKIYDQPVQYLPAYEQLPSAVADLDLQEGKVGAYAYRQEMADYTLGQWVWQWGPVNITFLYGDKLVDNPGFLSASGEDAVYYQPDSVRRLGIWQKNQGLSISSVLPGGATVEAELLSSQELWREYTGTHLVAGRSLPKYDVKGETSGQAGYVALSDLNLGSGQFGLSYQTVDPGFAPVAARHPDYAYGYYNQQFQDFTSPLTYRAVADPQLRYLRRTESSALISGLGLRKLSSSFAFPFSLLGKETITKINYAETRLSSNEGDNTWLDPLSGDIRVREFRQFDLLWEAAGNVGLALSNRQYFAQQDYLRTASAAWSGVRPLKTFLQLSVAQRARSAQILPGASESGAASGNLLAAGFGVRADQLGLTFSAGTEFRRGTYERDLSLATADRIFPEPYQLLITKLAAAKKYTWQRAAGEASVEAALELVQRSGQAASAGLAELLGMGSVSYLQVSFPWAGNLRQEMIIVSATGAERDGYPNQYVESVCHNELIWSFQPDGDAAFRLGYSVMPQEDGTKAENLYAVLGGKAGWANWSLTYGKGTLRQFTERPYLLAGQWQGPELNPGTAIAGKPWESWYSGSVAFGNKQTLSDLLTVRFWYSF